MSLTIMKQRSETIGQEWQAILLKSATETLTSASLMQKLTIIGLSNITFSRDIFPHQCYDIHKISRTLLIPILKERTLCEESNTFYQGIVSAFDAFRKRYLNKLILSIYEDGSRSDTIIESYSFSYKYGEEEVIIESSGKRGSKQSIFTSSVKTSTENLLHHSAFLFHSMDTLPDEFDLVLNLIYNNDAPEDYQPEGFIASRDSQDLHGLVTYMLGSVGTSHHKMKMCTHIHQKYRLNTPEHPQTLDNRETVEDDQMFLPKVSEDRDKSSKKDVSYENSENEGLHVDFLGMSLSMPSSGSKKSNDKNSNIRCPCTSQLDADQCMVYCNSCNIWQHAACFGLFQEDGDLLKLHICEECAANNHELMCSDPNMNNLSPQRKKELCLFRNILAHCLFYQEIDLPIFSDMFSISQRTLVKVFQRLNAYGIIQYDDLDNNKSYRVDLQVLKYKILPKFFPRSSVTDINHAEINENLKYDEVAETSQHFSNDEVANLSPIITFSKPKKPNSNVCNETVATPAIGGRKSYRMKRATKRYTEELVNSSLVPNPKRVKSNTKRLSLKRGDVNMEIS